MTAKLSSTGVALWGVLKNGEPAGLAGPLDNSHTWLLQVPISPEAEQQDPLLLLLQQQPSSKVQHAQPKSLKYCHPPNHPPATQSARSCREQWTGLRGHPSLPLLSRSLKMFLRESFIYFYWDANWESRRTTGRQSIQDRKMVWLSWNARGNIRLGINLRLDIFHFSLEKKILNQGTIVGWCGTCLLSKGPGEPG